MMRKTKLFPAFIGAAFFFSAAIVGCNNNGDSKSTKDSTTVKMSDTTKMMSKDTMMKKDSMPMDTSSVNKMKPRPIVPGNSGN